MDVEVFVTGDLGDIRAATGAQIIAPAKGRYEFGHRAVDEGDELMLGGLRVVAMASEWRQHCRAAASALTRPARTEHPELQQVASSGRGPLTLGRHSSYEVSNYAGCR